MNLSFANAKLPYLETFRSIVSPFPGGRDLGIGPRRKGNVRWEEVSQAAQPSGHK